MEEHFDGKLTFEDGDSVSIVLTFEGDALRIATDDKPVGVWPLKYCRISRTGTGSFRLSVDGEQVVFTPNEVEVFALAAAQRFQASSLADRIGVVRAAAEPETAHTEPPGPELHSASSAKHLADPVKPAVDWRAIGLLIGIVGIVVVAGILALTRDDAPALPPVLTDQASDEPQTTTTVDPALPALFEQTPAEFVAAWNDTAQSLGVSLDIRSPVSVGTFEIQLTPYIRLWGTTDTEDTMVSVIVDVDPSGTTDDDELALAAFGVAISVADPTVTPQGRREILERLGLDPDRPNLDGLEGEVGYPSATYRMQYFSEFNKILFYVIEP